MRKQNLLRLRANSCQKISTCITNTRQKSNDTIMPSYSSDQFHEDWVYTIDKDFQSSDGTPAQYAPNQPRYWGEEYARIPLPTSPSSSSLNADHSLIAVALEHEILIYATDGDMSLQQTLEGHVSKVNTVRFHPKDPEALVSCAMNSTGGSVPAEPAIIFWSLDEQRQRRLLSKEAVVQLGRRAASFAACDLEGLDTTSWELDEGEKESLGQDFGKAIRALNVKSQVRDNVRSMVAYPLYSEARYSTRQEAAWLSSPATARAQTATTSGTSASGTPSKRKPG